MREEKRMSEAKSGDKVSVHYTAKLDDGSVFDSSSGRDPLEFTIGEGQVIPGFEEAVVGMNPGETKSAQIAPQNAYGERHDEMIIVVDRKRLPEGMNPELGQQVEVHRPDGYVFIAIVTDVTDGTVTLDANHPLAGKNLNFDIELVNIL